MAQAIMADSFEPQKRGQAFALYGLVAVLAPSIGPTLGGWITDNYSWRWIFYINVPIGILGFFLQKMFVEDPPYLEATRHKAIDYIGLSLMVLAIGTLQLVLDKGQEADWFGSNWICWGTAIVLVSMPLFVWWELSSTNPFINLRLLKGRNFAVGTVMVAMMGSVMFASTAMLPIFMQKLLKYPAMQSGLAMTPRGFGSMAATIIIGRIVTKVENRLLLVLGFLGLGFSCLAFAHLNMDISRANIVIPQIFNGFSIGFLFVPMTVLTMSSLRQDELNQATGIYNLLRNIGASIGISIIFAFQTRMAQAHQVALIANISNYAPAFQQWSGQLHNSGVSQSMTYAIAYGKVAQQSAMLAFLDAFRWLAGLSFLCIPLAFLFHKEKRQRDEAIMEGECLEV